jgi:predicted ATPase/class 3 adenylate cyclase/Flp pilus assembly protein TadD
MAADHTLLHTDVVDSTAVNHRVGDVAMAALWAAHDQQSRTLLAHWRGREIDRSDGFMLLFDEPRDAAGFAAEYHRMLAALPVPLQARAGIHTGSVDRIDNSASDVARGAKPVEVIGIAKSISARLMTLAQGGQTLVSPSTAAQLAASPWRCRSHGHWRLKGLQDPLEVFELSEFETAGSIPPQDTEKGQRVVQVNGQWIPARQVPHNLPAERDGFVGRRSDLQAICDGLARGARLLTLLGPGGMGKTRLALRYSWAWQGDFPGGVWFCDLAQARSLDGTLQALAQTLEVSLGHDAVAQLGRAIAGRERCLVILDNFEQITAHAAATLGAWMDAAPMACFIVTTRERLGLPGETILALGPLDAADAIALFHGRAQAANAAYEAKEVDKETVQALVTLLDGLPLAIELAAPRVRVMTPEQLLARMGDRFRLLASPSGRTDRQATLHATLEWSWDLLNSAERSALAQSSVFEGGFDWTAAEAVLDLQSCAEAPWLVDVLQSLVDKSLLRTLSAGRFGLMGSVQAFAAEQLESMHSFPGSGELLTAGAKERHFKHYASLDEAAATSRRCVELDNLVQACRAAIAHEDGEAATACLRGAWAALRLTGPFGLGLRLAEQVGELSALGAEASAWTDWVAGCASHKMGDHAKALARLEGVLAKLQVDAHPMLAARLLCTTGEVTAVLGDRHSAASMLAQAERLAYVAGDPQTLCQVLNAAGALAFDLGRVEEARSKYLAGLTQAEALNAPRGQSGFLGNLGYLHYAEGRLDQAREAYERALALTQDTGDRQWEANTRCNLGLIHHDQGRSLLAKTELLQSLSMARAMGHRRLEAVVQCNLGIVCQSLGLISEAHVHFAAAVSGAHASGDRRSEGQFRGYLGVILARLGRIEDARHSLHQGRRLLEQVNDQLNLGLLWCSFADAETTAGNPQGADEALDCARNIMLRLNLDPSSELGRRVSQAERPL